MTTMRLGPVRRIGSQWQCQIEIDGIRPRLPDLLIVSASAWWDGGRSQLIGAERLEDDEVDTLTMAFEPNPYRRALVTLEIAAIQTDPTVGDEALQTLGLRRSRMDGLPMRFSLLFDPDAV